MLLTKATATGFTLAFTSTLAIAWAGSVDPFQVVLAVLFGVMALIGLALLVPYVRSRAMRLPVAGSGSPTPAAEALLRPS